MRLALVPRITGVVVGLVALAFIAGRVMRPSLAPPAPPFGQVPVTMVPIVKQEQRAPASPPLVIASQQVGTIGQAVDLLVLDPEMRPIPEARVWFSRGQGRGDQLVGTTSAEGWLSLPVQPDKAQHVSIRAPGFAWTYTPLDSLRTDAGGYQVVLRPAVQVHGRLVDANGRALALKGTVVVSRKLDAERISTEVAYRRITDGGVAACIPTTDTGSFEFDELEPGVEYTIVGSAPGLLSSGKPTEFVATGEIDDVLVRLETLYAVVVHIRDRAGAPINIPRDQQTEVVQSMDGLSESGFEIVPTSDAAGFWASREIPRTGLDKDQQLFTAVWLFRRRQEETAPMNFHWKAPNYDPVGIRVEPRAVSEDLTAYSVEAVRNRAVATGRVLVRVQASKVDLVAIRKAGGECFVKVMMIPRRGVGRTREQALALTGTDKTEWDAVESGAYSIRVYAGTTPVEATCEPEECDVEEGQTASVVVNIEALPCLVLELHAPDGQLYDGPLKTILWWDKVVLRTGGEGMRARITDFRTGPFCIVGAPQMGGKVQLAVPGYKESLVTFEAARDGIRRMRVILEKQSN